MAMKMYRSTEGRFLGATNGPPPPGAIEVVVPPADARAIWDGSAWIEPGPPSRWRVLKSTLMERMTDSEVAAHVALIATLPVRQRTLWEAVRYVASDDAQVLAAGAALGWTPQRLAELLAPDPHPDAQGAP